MAPRKPPLDLSDFADTTVLAVETVENLDPEKVARTESLGRSLDFTDAVPAFRRIRDFFGQIPKGELGELPERWRSLIGSQAKDVFQIYQAMMDFDPAKVSNAGGEREAYINQANGAYATVLKICSSSFPT